jgi:uncharacterized membrane protein YhaH (DUF805 family)
MLFSSEGRLNRKPFWISCLLTAIAEIVASVTVLIDPTGVIPMALFLLIGFTTFMPIIKRLHDRNHSGWYMLLMFVPLVNIWVSIQLYLLRGTQGENKYGKDPLADSGGGGRPLSCH